MPRGPWLNLHASSRTLRAVERAWGVGLEAGDAGGSEVGRAVDQGQAR
jgi:hypothetical protein